MIKVQCELEEGDRQTDHVFSPPTVLCVLGGVKTSRTKPFSPKVQRELVKKTHTELLKFMCAAQLHSRCRHN